MINVLVFPCGSEIGLEVHAALKYDKHLCLYGLSSVECHGRMVYKNYIEGISYIGTDTFMEELNQVIDEYSIDVLVPAYDDVILYLSDNRDKLHCKLATSSKETCDICRSKLKTYNLFKGEPFIPKTYNVENITPDMLPLFAKPDIGQGSQGTFVLKDFEDIENVKALKAPYVISQLLSGREYTIDCFTDATGELISSSMRERKRVRTGISVNSRTIPIPNEVVSIAQTINQKISFSGVWFFQVKMDADGCYKLLEIAPRVSGSMSTSRVRGFNYILNSIFQTMGMKVKALPHLLPSSEVERAFSSRFILPIKYDYVYLDFDDTITLKNEVNVSMMAFLYQCQNKHIPLILLTRHDGDIYESLKNLNIDKSLFDQIVHIKDETLKSKYIDHKNAIFIDDSFRERFDVSQNCGIPVFDLDCIDALMDWRY